MMLWFFVAHLGVVAITLAITARLMPQRVQARHWKTYLPVALISFSLPILGAVFCITAFMWALRHPSRVVKPNYAVCPVPEIAEPISATPQKQYSRGGLKAVLRHADCADKRQAAVMSTRFMDDREAIPILRMVLHDLEDDVRLLAYAMLDQKEGRINAAIHHLNHVLGTMPQPEQQAVIHQRLAENYWELSYLGITEGDLKRYVLEQAATHIQLAMVHQKDISALVLAGKICLAQGNTQAAEQYLQTALHNQGAEQQVLPYLAEVAFEQGDYQKTRQLLQQLAAPKGTLGVQSVKEYWA